MKEIFNTVIYEPLYNGLIFLTSIIPGADIGIAVIILTLTVKFILLPITHKSTQTQIKIKEIKPELDSLKEKYKDNKEEYARQTLELYKKHNINSFSSCIGLIVQIPVILGLYWVFLKGLNIDQELLATVKHIPGYINTTLLNNEIIYSFIQIPAFIKSNFLGLINMTGKSLPLALLAGLTQYIQIKLSTKGADKFSFNSSGSFKEDLAKSMKFQMMYVLPVFVIIFAYSISAAIALYWLTSNIFTIMNEYIVRKKSGINPITSVKQ